MRAVKPDPSDHSSLLNQVGDKVTDRVKISVREKQGKQKWSLILTATVGGRYSYYSHFTGEETGSKG